jgi:hypothetical protein
VIVGAQVSMRSDAAGEVRSASTNNEGRFKFDNLAPGGYTISVSQAGFKPAERAAVIDTGRPTTIEIRLEVAAPREKVEVGAKGALAPNSDPNYRQVRDGGPLEAYTVNNLALKRDAGTITLRSGRVSFLPPVMGRVVKAVFVGDGVFTLAPEMLRTIMYDRNTGDQRFIDMMHDFVKTYFNQNASTEGFKRVVEKHMTPAMDLDGNKRMDWFFNEWVYGTELPRYRIEYTLTPEPDGKVMLKLTVSQSSVSERFKMLVPIYMDFDGKWVRLGLVNLTGNTTAAELKVRLPQRPKRVVLNAFHDVLALESLSEQK